MSNDYYSGYTNPYQRKKKKNGGYNAMAGGMERANNAANLRPDNPFNPQLPQPNVVTPTVQFAPQPQLQQPQLNTQFNQPQLVQPQYNLQPSPQVVQPQYNLQSPQNVRPENPFNPQQPYTPIAEQVTQPGLQVTQPGYNLQQQPTSVAPNDPMYATPEAGMYAQALFEFKKRQAYAQQLGLPPNESPMPQTSQGLELRQMLQQRAIMERLYGRGGQ